MNSHDAFRFSVNSFHFIMFIVVADFIAKQNVFGILQDI